MIRDVEPVERRSQEWKVDGARQCFEPGASPVHHGGEWGRGPRQVGAIRRSRRADPGSFAAMLSTYPAACPAATVASGLPIWPMMAKKRFQRFGDPAEGRPLAAAAPRPIDGNRRETPPSRSWSGRISWRVEIDLKAGSISPSGPAPSRVRPTRISAPSHRQWIASSVQIIQASSSSRKVLYSPTYN